GQTHLKFVTDKDGNIDYLATDDFLPVELIQRVHGMEQLSLLKLFGIGTIVICLFTLAIWFGGWIARRRFKRPLEMSSGAARLRLGSRLGALLFLLVVGGWLGLISAISANEFLLFNGGLNMWMGLLYVIGAAAIAGGVAMAVNGVMRLIGGPG